MVLCGFIYIDVPERLDSVFYGVYLVLCSFIYVYIDLPERLNIFDNLKKDPLS